MAYKIKRISIIVGVFVVLSAGAFGTYQYKDSITDNVSPSITAIVEKVAPGYTSEYTMEEMTDKIFSHQKKLLKEVQEAYEEKPTVVKNSRITGDANMSLEVTSPQGGGDGEMKLSGLDFQYQENDIDISFEELSLGGKIEEIGNKLESSGIFKNIHLLKNESGSYLKIENNSTDSYGFAEDLMMTLNQLGKQGKYINFSDSPIAQELERGFKQSFEAASGDFQGAFLLELMENEKMLVVNKQEDTKYYLAPSEALCKMMKNERVETGIESDTTEKDSAVSGERQLANDGFQFQSGTVLSSAPEQMTYEIFKSDYASCDDTEYTEFVANFMKSDDHEIKQFYIEYSKTKTHYVFDMSLMNTDSGNTSAAADTDIVLNMGTDIVIALGSVEQSKTYFNIENNVVTGSGILLETNNDTFNMSLDIDIPKYELDTNMSFSGTTDSYNMAGDYTMNTPKADPMDNYPEIHEGMKISGDMTGSLKEGVSTFKMKNTFENEDQGVSGTVSIDSHNTLTDGNNVGDLLVTGEFIPGAGTTGVGGDITVEWDTTLTQGIAKGDMKYMLDIPNFATATYLLDYDLEMSDIIDASFETPKNIISEEDVESLLRKNKIIADKKAALEKQKKLEDLNNGKNTFSSYEIQAMNSKVTSDLRSLVSLIESKRTMGAVVLRDVMNDARVIKRHTAYTIYSGTIDFTALGQNEDRFISPFGGESYEFRIIEFRDQGENSMYEFGGDRYISDAFRKETKGNYYNTGINGVPEKLFDIEVK